MIQVELLTDIHIDNVPVKDIKNLIVQRTSFPTIQDRLNVTIGWMRYKGDIRRGDMVRFSGLHISTMQRVTAQLQVIDVRYTRQDEVFERLYFTGHATWDIY
jgi:hypothetical protein